jgi:hypothetical protein
MPLQVGLGYMNHIGALNYGIEGYARHYTGWGEGIDLGVNAALKMAF